jgi:hypothetical protein
MIDILTLHMVKSRLVKKLEDVFDDRYHADEAMEAILSVLMDPLFVVQIKCGISGEDNG